MNNAARKIERAMVGKGIEKVIEYVNKGEDRRGGLLQLVDLTEKLAGDLFLPESYQAARELIQEENGKWIGYVNRLLDEVDPNVLRMTAMNLGFEAAYHGTKTIRQKRKEHQCNVPWVILFDPTSACNLRCAGCWAAEYGPRLNLSLEELDDIINQGKELGVYFYMFTGGEPLMRKKDLIRLCEKHNECAFHAFTNGTLVDEEFCREMKRVGNLTLSLSLEGFAEANDSRRGQGVYDKVLAAMDLLKAQGLIFGASICYTRHNLETVTSDAFLDLLIQRGCRYSWYFHYMPVGNEASMELVPTATLSLLDI